MNLIHDIETYLADYATMTHERYLLPLALWIVGTFIYPEFDAYPYMVITSDTKRSGKTRLSELIGFACSNPRAFTGMSGPAMYRAIESEHPTIIFDEAESSSGESANRMKQVVNAGYRKGQSIPIPVGNGIKEFKCYCPKVFVLIGDANDTLTDRSIIVRMKRAEPKLRFTYDAVKERGAELRERIAAEVKQKSPEIIRLFEEHIGLPFLTDRDEEIWTPIFVLAALFCPDRIQELQAASVDIATEKTADKRRYVKLHDREYLDKMEAEATEAEYAERLLSDLYAILKGRTGHLSSEEAIEALRAIPVSPWRAFQGSGLDKRQMAHLLSRFGVKPVRVRIGYGRKNSKTLRGYTREDAEAAIKRNGVEK